ncbi:formate dehydrogenase accessory sulfurtransferase FdhD [Candidatus Omnitrophota bacterium]
MKTDIVRIDRGRREALRDCVADEVPLTIHINDEELLTVSCSPHDLKELSVGFLFSSGFVRSLAEIEAVKVDMKNWASYVKLKNKDIDKRMMFKRLYTPGCGKGALFYNPLDLMHRKTFGNGPAFESRKITGSMKIFQELAVTFRETGGVHSAALGDGERIVIFKEDIGRHNAVDKVIGAALAKGCGMEGMMFFTSGRVSSEIVLKVRKTGSCFIVSRSAPTDQAVKLARDLNMTLVGFARGQRMNVYSAKERIPHG